MKSKRLGKGRWVLGDCLEAMAKLPDNSVHSLISDIPYGISADSWDVIHNNSNSALGGNSPSQNNSNSAFKRRGMPLIGWSKADKNIGKEYRDWCSKWLQEAFRVLKPGSSIIIFAGRRYNHQCILALESESFVLKDIIGWVKISAHHRAQRADEFFKSKNDLKAAYEFKGWRMGNLRPIFEPIIWAIKPYKSVSSNMKEHGVGGYNQEEYVKYNGSYDNLVYSKEKATKGGFHPTQKPVSIMKSLVTLVTQPKQLVLDCFAGSGTTAIACEDTNRRWLCIEKDKDYSNKALNRIRQHIKEVKEKV